MTLPIRVLLAWSRDCSSERYFRIQKRALGFVKLWVRQLKREPQLAARPFRVDQPVPRHRKRLVPWSMVCPESTNSEDCKQRAGINKSRLSSFGKQYLVSTILPRSKQRLAQMFPICRI